MYANRDICTDVHVCMYMYVHEICPHTHNTCMVSTLEQITPAHKIKKAANSWVIGLLVSLARVYQNNTHTKNA